MKHNDAITITSAVKMLPSSHAITVQMRCNSGPRARDCCPPAGPSMGQQFIVTMNPATSGKSSTRSSGYHQKALAEIRNSLLPFANSGGPGENLGSSAASTISTLSTTSGVSSASGHSGISAASGSNGFDKELIRQAIVQLMNMGYSEGDLRALQSAKPDLPPQAFCTESLFVYV
ncbi:hypothetical protein C0J52_01744 [Blattella germanica]|nr:hypothetical protein C0J52_01744 [Blattella germanica]